MRTRLRSEAGFSLVEMLAVMFVLGLLMTAFSVQLTSVEHHASEIQEEALVGADARAVVDRIARDIRQAYSGTTSSPIESMSSTQIQFLSPDGDAAFHLRRLVYRLSGGNIQRAEALSTNTGSAPWTFQPLGAYVNQLSASDVTSSSIFTYYDSTGATTSDPNSVASVGISVTVATKVDPSRQFTYSTSATLRTAASS
jgi:prepilin-type N-terminal cleavage/methylation domain-containing protein